MHVRSLVALLALLTAAACDGMVEPSASDSSAEPDLASANASPRASDQRTYEVTVYNLTSGQPFTPPAAATHRRAADLFQVGSAASYEVKEIAENGNLAPMVTALESSRHVSDVVVAVAGDPPPVLPGGSVTFEIEAEDGAQFFSFVSMLICTNDGFTGLDSRKLPNRLYEQVTFDIAAYDAGTEVNTEDFADIVPPCPPLTGVASSDPGAGMSDPTLAENGVIRHHPGIMGGDDLQTGLHGWSEPVGRVSIRRVD
jgi:hypothetical protein